MTPREAAVLLTKLAAYDNRQPSEAAARAWAEVLIDVDLQEALDAVPEHFRQSTDWVMPAHILRIVEDHRRERHRLQREAAEQERAAIEAAQRGPVEDRSADVLQLVHQARTLLPDGKPDKLRYGTREWNRSRRLRERPDAQPNPQYWARAGAPPPDLADPTAEPA